MIAGLRHGVGNTVDLGRDRTVTALDDAKDGDAPAVRIAEPDVASAPIEAFLGDLAEVGDHFVRRAHAEPGAALAEDLPSGRDAPEADDRLVVLLHDVTTRGSSMVNASTNRRKVA